MKIKAIIEKNDEGFYQIHSCNLETIIGCGFSEDEAKKDFLECIKEFADFNEERDGKRPEWENAEVEYAYNYNMKTTYRVDAASYHHQKDVLCRLIGTMDNYEEKEYNDQVAALSITFDSHKDSWTGMVFNGESLEGLETRLQEEPREAIRNIRTWLEDICDEDNDACSTLLYGHDGDILLHFEDNLCAANAGVECMERQGTLVVLTNFSEEPVFKICCRRGDLIQAMYEAVIKFLKEKEDDEDNARKWSKNLFGGLISIEIDLSGLDSPVAAFRSFKIEELIY